MDTKKSLIRVNRAASWILALVSGVMLATGYIVTRFEVNKSLIIYIHTNLCYVFTAIFIIHFYISVFIIRYPWKNTLKNLLRGKIGKWTLIKLTQQISAWAIVIGAGVMIITGLGWYGLFWWIIPFSRHRLFDVLAGVSIIIHVSTGSKCALNRMQIGGKTANIIIILFSIILIVIVFCVDSIS